MIASDQWYFKAGGEVHGPVSHMELREKARAGEIGPDALIRSEKRDWRRAENWKRLVETELSNSGLGDVVVQTYLDGERKVVVRVTHGGRTADGLPDLVLSAIEDARQHGISLTQAFEARNMYADAI